MILLFLFALFIVSPSAEESTGPERVGFDYKNTPYNHLSVKEQLEEYASIYNDIYKRNPDTPYLTHSDGLFTKLQNAFILTYDFLANQNNGTETDKPLQIQELSRLETLYQATLQMQNEQGLSPLHFERINILCALLGHDYRPYLEENFINDINELSSKLHQKWSSASDLIQFIKIEMDNCEIGEVDKDLRENTNFFFPMAFIYSDNSLPIGYNTFIKSFFEHSFPLYVGNFYPNKNPIMYTKSQPHYSTVNGFMTFIIHDLNHRVIIFSIQLKTDQSFHFNWFKYLKPLYEKAESKKSISKGKLLDSALFLFIHENYFGENYSPKYYVAREIKTPFKLLNKNIKIVKKHIIRNLPLRHTSSYKDAFRDYEKVLFYSYNPLNPWLPLVNVEGKLKLLPYAWNANNDPVLVIKKRNDNTFKYHPAKNTDLALIHYSPPGNLELPEGWKWMTKQERKELEKGSNKGKSEVYYMRNLLATKYLQRGFEKYWDAFLESVKDVYKEEKPS